MDGGKRGGLTARAVDLQGNETSDDIDLEEDTAYR